MAGYAFQIIPIKKFPSDGHFSCRYDLEDSALSQSVKKWGVLFPLIVTRKSYQLIAGHKRFYASLKLGQDLLPALEIQKVLSEGEAFIFSALSNWNQNWAEMDRVTTLSKAKNQYQVPSEELVEFWLPALGLPSERHFLDSYLQLAALHEDLKHLIHHQRLPFRGASLLLNFSQDDQKAFALHIGAKLKLTSNQLLKIAEWIKDLCVLKKTNIEKLLAETNLV
ncbi:MAG: ParB N-terminal domain-containing protein, partial [Candidatus Omnitrophica bacterium]|nr:ParB N-terminal domain-containing protein [Candidatus Omnitrophota bacterium]